MTAINGTSPYAAYQPYANTAATNTQSTSSTNSNKTNANDTATTVDFSEEAKKKLDEKTYTTVVSEAREALDKLLADAALTSPYEDDELAIDLVALDRRELFAISTNAEGKFTVDEQKAAIEELASRFDAAMTGPAAVARVTDELIELYEAAAKYLEDASPEEKATYAWTTKKAAVDEAITQLTDDPDSPPKVDDDPVADYMVRSSTGDTAKTRGFGDIASDARSALDKQYADAKDNGEELVFNARRQTGQMVDFSKFDSRTLSAIALNEGDQFTGEEIFAAKGEMHTRSCKTLLACFNHAGESGDPTALSKALISAYGSLSSEERTAAGWGEDFYNNILLNYETSTRIADMFSAASAGNSGGAGLLGF